jgi:hypothetical protein
MTARAIERLSIWPATMSDRPPGSRAARGALPRPQGQAGPGLPTGAGHRGCDHAHRGLEDDDRAVRGRSGAPLRPRTAPEDIQGSRTRTIEAPQPLHRRHRRP